MDQSDTVLLQKIRDHVSDGLTEANALQFFALLSITEYDRLITLFEQGPHTGLSLSLRAKLVSILKKLRMAKAGR